MSPAIENVLGDIQLNGINYRVDLQSYRVRDI